MENNVVSFSCDNGYTTFSFNLDECHSYRLNDNPPKSWNDIYKLYLSYTIRRTVDIGDGNPSVVGEFSIWDENSYLPTLLSNLISKEKNFRESINEIGFLSTCDIVLKTYYGSKSITDLPEQIYRIDFFNHYTGDGFRMLLNRKECKKFIEFLSNFLDKMLVNSEA